MKAITILEPWASLIACGAKKIETRSWSTKYRGNIAIHAAKSRGQIGNVNFNKKLFSEPFLTALKPFSIYRNDGNLSGISFNYGKVIAIADLVDCYYIVYHPGTNVDIAKHINVGAESMTNDKHDPDFSKYTVPSEQELSFGDWTPGHYAWILENVRRIDPVPAKGKQRIWNWEGNI
jgi:activating signal cointegrator 1